MDQVLPDPAVAGNGAVFFEADKFGLAPAISAAAFLVLDAIEFRRCKLFDMKETKCSLSIILPACYVEGPTYIRGCRKV